MLIIRPEKPQDIEVIHEVNVLAFGRDNEALLVDALRRSAAFIPELSLVAEEDGQVIGHILFSRIRIVGRDKCFPALALAPMAVRPDRQRRGIGSALVQMGLEEAFELGHAVAIVLGHPQFYPRFGFRPAADIGIQAPFEVPARAFMVCVLDPDALVGFAGVVEYPVEFSGV